MSNHDRSNHDRRIMSENPGVYIAMKSAVKFSIQTIDNRPCHGFDAILTREVITREKLQFLYENVMSNNFRRTVVLNI